MLFYPSIHSMAAHTKGVSLEAIPLELFPGPMLTSLLFPVLLPQS